MTRSAASASLLLLVWLRRGRCPPTPPPHPQPPFARLYGGGKKEHSTDAPQEVGWPLGWDLDPGIELEKHTLSPDQTSYFIPIFIMDSIGGGISH